MSDTPSNLRLLTPHTGAHLRTPNRVAMPAMTRNRAGETRVPNDWMARYYAQRATAGLQVTESVDVCPGAIGYPGTPGIYTAEMADGWRKVVESVRAAQPSPRPFFLQLFHTGRVSHVSLREGGAPPDAPSAIRADVQLFTPEGMQPASEPRALTEGDIARLVAQYAEAATSARDAGFDGVEINAGNGYLVDQFLRDGTNHRGDRYGGAIENRVRFLMELVEAISGAIGPERVAVRVSPINETNGVTDSDPASLFTAVAEGLAPRGLAYLHVIEAADRRTLTPTMRERFRGTLVVNDGYDRDRAEAAIREGLADLVAFGKLFLANPDLPRRFAEGAPLNEPDPATFYGGDETGYTDYPTLDG